MPYTVTAMPDYSALSHSISKFSDRLQEQRDREKQTQGLVKAFAAVDGLPERLGYTDKNAMLNDRSKDILGRIEGVMTSEKLKNFEQARQLNDAHMREYGSIAQERAQRAAEGEMRAQGRNTFNQQIGQYLQPFDMPLAPGEAAPTITPEEFTRIAGQSNLHPQDMEDIGRSMRNIGLMGPGVNSEGMGQMSPKDIQPKTTLIDGKKVIYNPNTGAWQPFEEKTAQERPLDPATAKLRRAHAQQVFDRATTEWEKAMQEAEDRVDMYSPKPSHLFGLGGSKGDPAKLASAQAHLARVKARQPKAFDYLGEAPSDENGTPDGTEVTPPETSGISVEDFKKSPFFRPKK